MPKLPLLTSDQIHDAFDLTFEYAFKLYISYSTETDDAYELATEYADEYIEALVIYDMSVKKSHAFAYARVNLRMCITQALTYSKTHTDLVNKAAAKDMKRCEDSEFIIAKAFVITHSPSELINSYYINPYPSEFDDFVHIYSKEKGPVFYPWFIENDYKLKLECKNIPIIWKEFMRVKETVLSFWAGQSLFRTLGDDVDKIIYSYVFDEMWDLVKKV